MYPDLSLDHQILKDIVVKAPDGQRALRSGPLPITEQEISERRACQPIALSRYGNRYQNTRPDHGPIIGALTELTERHLRFGSRKLFVFTPQGGQSLESQARLGRVLRHKF